MKNIKAKETDKRIKVYLFETALTESTEKERWLYGLMLTDFERELPDKVNEKLDDNAKANLFFAERWEDIKKELPFTFRIFKEYLDRIAVCLNYDLNRTSESQLNHDGAKLTRRDMPQYKKRLY